jgi:hypothetical protein
MGLNYSSSHRKYLYRKVGFMNGWSIHEMRFYVQKTRIVNRPSKAFKLLMHYLDVRKKRSRNEFEEDIDRELE